MATQWMKYTLNQSRSKKCPCDCVRKHGICTKIRVLTLRSFPNEEQAPHLVTVQSPPQMVECTKKYDLAFTMEIKLIPRKSFTAAYKELVSKLLHRSRLTLNHCLPQGLLWQKKKKNLKYRLLVHWKSRMCKKKVLFDRKLMAHFILSPVKPKWQAISICIIALWGKTRKSPIIGNPCCFKKMFKEVMNSNKNVPFFQKKQKWIEIC